MTSHSNSRATDNDRAAVAGTVVTAGDGIGNGAVVAGTVPTTVPVASATVPVMVATVTVAPATVTVVSASAARSSSSPAP